MNWKNDLDLMDMLHEIGRALTSALDVDEILKLIMDYVHTVYRPENWSLLLTDEEQNDLYFAVTVGPVSEKIKHKRLKMGEGVAGWAALHEETVVVGDVYGDQRFAHWFDRESGFRTDSIICVPMISRKHVMGVIEIVNIPASGPAQADLKILEALADFAAIAIENARYLQRIEQLSIHDDCTCLYNARHMYEILYEEIGRSKEEHTPLSVIFFDMDYFKNINDTYGHLIGSALLKKVGDLVVEISGPLDRGVRYGGDEFVLILPGVGREAALAVTRKLRDRLNHSVFFREQGLQIRVTASFGIAVYPEQASSADEIIKLADDAMYYVKEHNRDGICLSGGGLVA